MKYFEVQDTPELKYAPKLRNWYGKFDVRNIRIDLFPRLPDMQLFITEPLESMVFTDIILSPFLLVSPMVYEVLRMYRERCFFKKIILLNQLQRESRLYYLPVLDETNQLSLHRVEYKNGFLYSERRDISGRKTEVPLNLFWVRDSKKRHIIMSMDMADSLIRRGVRGLGLCEVELYYRE